MPPESRRVDQEISDTRFGSFIRRRSHWSSYIAPGPGPRRGPPVRRVRVLEPKCPRASAVGVEKSIAPRSAVRYLPANRSIARQRSAGCTSLRLVCRASSVGCRPATAASRHVQSATSWPISHREWEIGSLRRGASEPDLEALTDHSKAQSMLVDLRTEDGIATVVLNKPHRLNALDPEAVDQLCEAIDRSARSGARAIVIRGSGRSFCAGHDLKYQAESDSHTPFEEVDRVQDITRAIRNAPIPVIASVHGYALGAGCELALCSDLVIASDTAVFGFPEIGVGLSITGGISRLLALSVGLVKAKELVLLGEYFDARKALSLGLINFVVSDADLREETRRIAKTLASKPQLALSLGKAVLNSAIDRPMDATLDLESMHALRTRVSPDAREQALHFSEASGDSR